MSFGVFQVQKRLVTMKSHSRHWHLSLKDRIKWRWSFAIYFLLDLNHTCEWREHVNPWSPLPSISLICWAETLNCFSSQSVVRIGDPIRYDFPTELIHHSNLSNSSMWIYVARKFFDPSYHPSWYWRRLGVKRTVVEYRMTAPTKTYRLPCFSEAQLCAWH